MLKIPVYYVINKQAARPKHQENIMGEQTEKNVQSAEQTAVSQKTRFMQMIEKPVFRRWFNRLLALSLFIAIEAYFVISGYEVAFMLAWVLVVCAGLVKIFLYYVDIQTEIEQQLEVIQSADVNDEAYDSYEYYEDELYQASETARLRLERLERQADLLNARAQKPPVSFGQGLIIGAMLGFYI
jgi:hypothetical protein